MEAAVNNSRCHQGANVARWREWRGYNQRTFAEKIGLSASRLGALEKTRELDEKFLVQVAKELDIPLEALTDMEEGATVNVYSGTFSDNAGVFGSVNSNSPSFNPVDKLVDVYERMLKEKDEMLKEKDELLKERDIIIAALRGTHKDQ